MSCNDMGELVGESEVLHGREASSVWVTRLHDGVVAANADVRVIDACDGTLLWSGTRDPYHRRLVGVAGRWGLPLLSVEGNHVGAFPSATARDAAVAVLEEHHPAG